MTKYVWCEHEWTRMEKENATSGHMAAVVIYGLNTSGVLSETSQ